MLGWNIPVYRLADEALQEVRGGAEKVRAELASRSTDDERLVSRDPSGLGNRLAVWQASSFATTRDTSLSTCRVYLAGDRT